MISRALLGREHRVAGRVGGAGHADELVLALDRRQPAHDRRVHPLVAGDLEDHLLVDPRRVRLGHRAEEVRARVLEVRPDLGGEQHRSLQQRGAHVLPASGLLACDERGEDARRHEEHRSHARQRHVQEDRSHPPARLLPLLATARLHERVVARAIGPTVALRVGRARHEDEPRIARVQRVEADAESVHHAGPERLHDDVGVGGEPVERLDPFGRLQVDRDRAARTVPHRVTAVVAERITARGFDLDHVGALLGEQQNTERACDPPRQVEDAADLRGLRAYADPLIELTPVSRCSAIPRLVASRSGVPRR